MEMAPRRFDLDLKTWRQGLLSEMFFSLFADWWHAGTKDMQKRRGIVLVSRLDTTANCLLPKRHPALVLCAFLNRTYIAREGAEFE